MDGNEEPADHCIEMQPLRHLGLTTFSWGEFQTFSSNL